jgi:hypothetical protein
MLAGGVPRIASFARGLRDSGWEVTVLTNSPSSLVPESDEGFSGIDIIRTWSPKGSLGSRTMASGGAESTSSIVRAKLAIARLILFPDRFILWGPGAVLKIRSLLKRRAYDVVLTSYGPGTNLLAIYLARAWKHAALFVDFRDLWSTMVGVKFVTPLHRRMVHAIEGTVVRHAFGISGTAPAMGKHIVAEHGVSAELAHCLTNGYEESDTQKICDVRTAQDRPFRLVYTGSIHKHYDLGPFFSAVRKLEANRLISTEDFNILFVTNVGMDYFESHGVSHFVELKPLESREKLFENFRDADACLLIELPGYYKEFSYAAKGFDYLLTGKPVLALVEDESNSSKLFSEVGTGYQADPRDSEMILERLKEVLLTKNAPALDVDIAAEPYCKFNRATIARHLSAILDQEIKNRIESREIS